MDFLAWWQTLPSKMDPVLISIGPLTIYWYSTMYLVAFGVVYILCSKKIKQNRFKKINLEQFEDLLSWCFIGLLIGARFGYVIFYNFEYYLSNPLEIIIPFKYYNGNWIFTGIAGMSYHGGVIGVVVAIWLFSRKVKLHFFELADFLTAAIPLGYFLVELETLLMENYTGGQLKHLLECISLTLEIMHCVILLNYMKHFLRELFSIMLLTHLINIISLDLIVEHMYLAMGLYDFLLSILENQILT